ncbi:MAG: hypothetical protein Kow0090_09730 [Myxococcota bacterium]
MKQTALFILTVLIAAHSATAQDWTGGGGGQPPGATGIETAPPPAQDLPAIKEADVDPHSSLAYAPIEIGFHLELEPGVAMTFGGSKAVSDAAPYIGADIGYDISPNIAFGINFAYVASVGSARSKDTELVTNYNGAFKDYTMLISDVFFEYRLDVAERLAVLFDLVGGATLLAPLNHSEFDYNGTPLNQADPLGSAGDAASTNFNFGLQTGVHYYTYMRHVNLGMELGFYYILPTGIPALAVYPSLRYTF